MRRFNAIVVLAAAISLSACQTEMAPPNSSADEAGHGVINRPFKPGEVHIVHRITGDQMAQLYPSQAVRNRIGGDALVRCHVEPSGLPNSCVILNESPAGLGFGAASILAAEQCRLAPGPYGPDATFDMPIRWRLSP
jgi:TonB family protein